MLEFRILVTLGGSEGEGTQDSLGWGLGGLGMFCNVSRILGTWEYRVYENASSCSTMCALFSKRVVLSSKFYRRMRADLTERKRRGEQITLPLPHPTKRTALSVAHIPVWFGQTKKQKIISRADFKGKSTPFTPI